MHIIKYNNFETLENLKDDWQSLLKECASDVPFLTYDYLRTWWQTRGGGEWSASSELVLLVAYEDERRVGIAPLFHTDNIQGKPALLFVGSIEVSDFLDFIVRPDDLPKFIHAVLDFVTQSTDIPSWELLDLYNILENSRSLSILKSESQNRGWSHQEIPLQQAPYIPLPGDYEQYLAQIDKKQRHEIRRKLRNVTQDPRESNFYFADDLNCLHDETQAFIEMMAQDPNKRAFLTAEMRQHLHNTAQVAFENGWLQLAFFTLNGEKAAANMSFNYNDRLWLYNSGWEWKYRDFSPGWVLLAHMLQWANENAITEFDFMRGDEPYKYKFGGIDRLVFRVTMTPQ
jgi:CelD/BcsL family acetyltransferase involved in cellulose biosynthesis